ncbi:long-chain fatty acid--CoA ligase [Sphingomonas crusticola]|uniref:long-chain fatty acid--CoA ligase n=1 Tax=Sphingomonas crusticola TaxID=1697973 RepID=UPI001F0750E7|nr:long-chain fatty acid--CoA ligase [Sphingomonas crusticola]
MQVEPLLLSALLVHAEENFGDVEIVAWEPERFSYTYAQAGQRARKLASGLLKLGLHPGETVGSLAWTTHRHFELMYAVPGIGAVLHTANPRLSARQIAFTINHAADRFLFVDPDCITLAAELAPLLTTVERFIIMGPPRESDPSGLTLGYFDDILAAGDADFAWPSFDERTASTLCFTSGTTGDPKGVLYSNRGSLLSAMAIAPADGWDVSASDTIMPAAAFFHCNGWGAPYLAPMVGARLVLPGRAVDGETMLKIISEEGVTVGSGVPTVWMGLLDQCIRTGRAPGTLNRIVCGGAAPPPAMMSDFFTRFGVRTIQVWGMTETTHAATMLSTRPDVLTGATEALAPQGKPVFGTRLRVIGPGGAQLPNDGTTPGQLQVKGPWCATEYLGRDDIQLCDEEGWMNTGDLATVSAREGLRITDRIKDVIKSGGEWVSSIDLEHAAREHDDVLEAAVIGVPHPRWQERPVLFIVSRDGARLSPADVIAYLKPRVPKLWVPDDVILMDALPHNSTGKVSKEDLRQIYGERVRAG